MLVEQSLGLFLSLLKNLTGLLSFIVILWQLSGTPQPYSPDTTSRCTAIWCGWRWGMGYYSLLAHLDSRPLHRLNIDRQNRGRPPSLLRIRENSEQIAFYDGERAERATHRHFSAIARNWQQLMWREFHLDTFTTSYFRLSLMIPIFAVLPLYIAKRSRLAASCGHAPLSAMSLTPSAGLSIPTARSWPGQRR
jgi:putative ATP-binding cassette transporter